jgi:hypothetical protein
MMGSMKKENRRMYIVARNQAGQAVMEYTLLLIITLSIFAGLSTQIFPSIKKITDFYLGTYTNCLLDYGELPNIAGGTVSDCDQLAAADGYGPGAPGGGAAGANNQQAQQQAAAARRRAQAAASAERAAANRRSAQHSSGRQREEDDLSTRKGADAVGGNENVTNMGSVDRYRTRYAGGSGLRDPKRIRVVSVRGFLDDEREKILGRQERISRTDADSGVNLKPKKFQLKPPDRKPTVVSEEMGGFSFGNILRIAVMIMIIVAVLYLMAMQINSITKSMEK